MRRTVRARTRELRLLPHILSTKEIAKKKKSFHALFLLDLDLESRLASDFHSSLKLSLHTVKLDKWNYNSLLEPDELISNIGKSDKNKTKPNNKIVTQKYNFCHKTQTNKINSLLLSLSYCLYSNTILHFSPQFLNTLFRSYLI